MFYIDIPTFLWVLGIVFQYPFAMNNFIFGFKTCIYSLLLKNII